MSVPNEWLRLMRERLGYDSLRPGQQTVLSALADGRDVLAVMPTGSGKSLCYQLPALALDGTGLVISPLVALMKDQVEQLTHRGVSAAALHSAQSARDRQSAEEAFSSGRLKLLFVSPERLASDRFRRLLARRRPSLVAVDEAHCTSEWGHAFRPDYEQLGEVISALGNVPRLALTATATAEVREEIADRLRLRQPLLHIASFDRPNIHLEAHALRSGAEKLDTLVRALGQHSPAIVYAATRRRTEELVFRLSRQGIDCAAYHAGLATPVREAVQDRFLSGALQVVIATNAFGLGVDKPDVRLVAHHEPPRSLEAYYQEFGRAGRDGKPALAVLLHSPQDALLTQHLIGSGHPTPQLARALLLELARSAAPVSRDRLTAAVGISQRAPQLGATLAFLEGIGATQRSYGAAVPGLSADLRYQLRPGAGLTPAHLERLRQRTLRDRRRFGQLLAYATTRSCRRRALLSAMGETRPLGTETCHACDRCHGPKIDPIRSRLFHGSRREADMPDG